MRQSCSFWLVTFLVVGVTRQGVYGDQDSTLDAIRSLREQVNALLDHRQQDYNALEESLKRAIEKNTELFVLKNEVKQLRKEVIGIRGSGNGNEAKNEKLRVRWLGNAVTELQGEVAQVLRTRNASEELAERSRLRGELALIKGDVGAVGRGIRNLGGRIAKIEAVLGTIRIDIAAVKERFSQLSRSCADIASQLSAVQMEVKSVRCESAGSSKPNERGEKLYGQGREEDAEPVERKKGEKGEKDEKGGGVVRELVRRRSSKRHRSRVVDRLKSLERKVSLTTQRRVALEKRAFYENQRWSKLNERMGRLEKVQDELSRQVSNVTENAILTKSIGESLGSRLIEWLRALEEAVERNNSSTKRELLRLSVNVARKAAELSLTREELNNLRRTVQALSVSASKLQERSLKQQEAIDRLNNNSRSVLDLDLDLDLDVDLSNANLSAVRESTSLPYDNVERLEDRYHLIGNDLPENCEQRRSTKKAENGIRLLRTTGRSDGKPSRVMLVFCREEWMVVGRRIDGSLDFDRSWNEYSLGFGSPLGEYWIGNEILHRLTRENCTSLRVDLLDIYGERWRAEYQRFAVESKEQGYKLHVYGYAGNATDALSYQNDMPFSAKDRDMDASSTHCARNYHGGWWFSHCQHANLNGKYSLGLAWFRSDTNRWMSIASAELSIRRISDCRSDR